MIQTVSFLLNLILICIGEFMTLLKELSYSEIAMFEGLPLNHLLYQSLEVLPFYRMVMEEVFIQNCHGPHVEALRICMKNLKECNIYRHTSKYDAMINQELLCQRGTIG